MYWIIIKTGPYRYELATPHAFSDRPAALTYAEQLDKPFTIVTPALSAHFEA